MTDHQQPTCKSSSDSGMPIAQEEHATEAVSDLQQLDHQDTAEMCAQKAATERLAVLTRKSQQRITAKSCVSIFTQIYRTGRRLGFSRVAIIEPDGKEITYQDIIRGSLALGSAFSKKTSRAESVGILLPTSAAALISMFGLQAYGRIPAMLNFSTGVTSLQSALTTAQIKIVITARKFVKEGGYEALITSLEKLVNILYLEDIRADLTMGDKAKAAIGEKMPWLVTRPLAPEAPAVTLFTSGTEGEPKGVLLSSKNLIANVEQVNEHVQLEADDIIINPLPVFHSYGLTAGSLFALFCGKKLVVYPSPLHVKTIPEVIQKTRATIVFATDTFLHRYLKAAQPDSMISLRYAVCGAEHVHDETRALARRKFGFNVLEGYGMTEASPVVAANQPGDVRAGTVGKILPGIETRLEPVPGFNIGKRLYIKGPNVMMGYMLANRPGEIIPIKDGWYDTGDVVDMDDSGYMTIRGRVKRFAKIGGEMISLSVVENCAAAVWPDYQHAAVSLPSAKKGEQIILLTEFPTPCHTEILRWAQLHGVPEIAVPRRILPIKEIPVLGSGKINYFALEKQAASLVAMPAVDAQDAPAPVQDVAQ